MTKIPDQSCSSNPGVVTNNAPKEDPIAAQEMEALEDTLVEIVAKRGLDKTCWPSEIPRKLYSWKSLTKERKCELMDQTRQIAYEKAAMGFLYILQKGKVVPNPTKETVKGPIRLRLATTLQK